MVFFLKKKGSVGADIVGAVQFVEFSRSAKAQTIAQNVLWAPPQTIHKFGVTE
jgi:hypothetical protein